MKEVNSKSMNRRGLLLAPIACVIALSACVATKQDVRLLRADIATLQARQDSLNREALRSMSVQADSVRMLSETLRAVRGQLTNQIRQLQDMLITIQELLGTNAQTVRQLREQLERQQQQPADRAAPPPNTANPAEADNLYFAARTRLEEKSGAAARAAFEQFLSQFPNDARAPDAQLGLAEAIVLTGELEEAIPQFERVSAAYPSSARAPEALYRAGQVSEQRKRIADARRFYNMVVNRYAGSPSARLAKQRLAALPAR